MPECGKMFCHRHMNGDQMCEFDKVPPVLNWLCPVSEHNDHHNSDSYILAGWQKSDLIENIKKHWAEFHRDRSFPSMLKVTIVSFPHIME